MYSVSKKYQRFWFLILKFSFVLGAGYFIYRRVFLDTDLPLDSLIRLTKEGVFYQPWLVLLVILLSFLNWFFEVLKWQCLAREIAVISFFTATKQSLVSHIMAIVTPLKTGEYIGKALFFEKKKRYKVLLLNLIGNMWQLVTTFVFGVMGLFYFLTQFNVPIPLYKLRRVAYILAIILGFLVVGKILIKNRKWRLYQSAFTYYKSISNSLKTKVLLLSVLRYFVFSHQFFLLLMIFGVEVTYSTAILLIFSMYFLATILPVMSLLDFVIKGSIAIYLFTFVGADEFIILLVSTLMWLLNFVLPAVVGAYFLVWTKRKQDSLI